MTKVRAPVKCGQLGKLAGVKGAAYGASFQLKMRDDLRKVRAAVGNSLGASPQKITESQVRSRPSSCHRLPPPCALQCAGVPPVAAALKQPSF
jgi:hypothetical protein